MSHYAFRTSLVLAMALCASSLYAQTTASQPSPVDPASVPAPSLEEQFRDPPVSARPRVWWHWIAGNVSKEGIEKDLDWMKRIGIAGLQKFDAAVGSPQIVDKPVTYMSLEWRDAFRFAVSHAASLGLEYGIAASPGWSETGGPWVKPDDAMKKLVWSRTLVEGGRRFDAILARPSSVAGPYQDISREPDHGYKAPDFYRDAAVIAFRQTPAIRPLPEQVLSNNIAIDAASLVDDDYGTGVNLPGATAEGPGTLTFTYERPVTVRSATVYVANLQGSATAGPLVPKLEASEDGRTWRNVASVPLSKAPTTVSFAPVKARAFRLVMTRGARADRSSFAPAAGVDLRMAAGIGGSGGSPAPQKLSTFVLSSEPSVHAAELKAGFALASDYYALDAGVPDEPGTIAPADVVDLTAAMDAEGRLQWTAPKGRWIVLRMGYSLTGKVNAPATKEATGLEVDKYDAAAVTRYLTTYLDGFRNVTGDALFGRRGLATLVTDSTEVGPSNWTPDILAKFEQLRGYDPRPWLPTLTGTIVGSRRKSDEFLYDFRRTLADLTASEHYGTIARIAKGQGLTVYSESLEGGRAISSLGDDLDMRKHADVPMAAMWTYGKTPAPNLVADMRGAASVAHVYGRQYVAAESLTSILNPWAYAPSDLQPMIDVEFVNGINRPFLHSVVHQPRDDRQPGLSLQAFGQYFNRHETWADMAKPWIDYIARTSLLLQQGRNVADVAYFYGEEAPIGAMAEQGYPSGLPKHYGYDFISADMLMNALKPIDGTLVSDGGARYRAVLLGGSSSRMTVPVLRKLAALADAGVAIIGDAPSSSPSLADDPKVFAALVGRIWTSGRQGSSVLSGDIEAVLAARGIEPDFQYQGQPDSDIQFVHRSTADGEIYFVSNRKLRAEKILADFRVSGKAAELWHAEDGTSEPVSYLIDGGRTSVPLDLAPGQSVFVLFRKSAPSAAETFAARQWRTLGTIAGPWDVRFQEGRGAPSAAKMDELASLSSSEDPGIRFFSGVASYKTAFQLPRASDSQSLQLDLGRVGDVAEVFVNGKSAGIAWKAPYRVEIGHLVHEGRNALEVRVANLWVNRLIGDQQPGAERFAFTTTPTFTAKAPLRPSGLIGPVSLIAPAP